MSFTQNADLWSWTVNVSAVKVLKATDCVSLGMCQTAYFELKRISSIRRFHTQDVSKTLVTSYILTRLDYSTCLLIGALNSVIQPLHKVRNFAARLILMVPRHYHSTPFLKKLHWLPISECVKYQVACMRFSCQRSDAVSYTHLTLPTRRTV